MVLAAGCGGGSGDGGGTEVDEANPCPGLLATVVGLSEGLEVAADGSVVIDRSDTEIGDKATAYIAARNNAQDAGCSVS